MRDLIIIQSEETKNKIHYFKEIQKGAKKRLKANN